MYKISYEDKDIVVRFDSSEIDKETLMDLLDFADMEMIRKKSKLSKEEAFAISKEINKDAWNKVKDKVLEG
jgi:hypothetical protein